jgi:hypothetical protein
MKTVVEHARRVDPTIPADAADKLLAEGGEAGVALGRRDVGADRGLLLGRDEALEEARPGLRRAGLKKDA